MEKIKKSREVLRRVFTTQCIALGKLLDAEHVDSQQVRSQFRVFEDNMLTLTQKDEEIYENLLEIGATEDELETHLNEVSQYKLKFETMKVKVTDLETQLLKVDISNSSETAHNNVRKFKLPVIEFRKYGGDVREWIPFWSQFRKVHEDSNIPPEDKFLYLMQAVIPGTRASDILQNLNLKRTVEEQEDQLRCQQAFQQSNITCQNKVREVMKEVQSQLQKLEEDQQYLSRTVEAANSLSSRLQMNAKHYSCIREKERHQMKNLEQTVIELRAEMDALQETQKPAIVERNYEDLISNMEATVAEMKARLEAEYEGSNKLNAAIAEALKTVSQSQSHEAAARQKALELSEELEKERERAIHLEADNASLQHQLEMLQETLQEERKTQEVTETPEQTDEVLGKHKLVEPLEVCQADGAVKELNSKNSYTISNSEIVQVDVVMKDGLNCETSSAVNNNFEICPRQQNLCSMDITPQMDLPEANNALDNISV